MPTSALTPARTAGYSSDITFTTIGTIALYRALDDAFMLPDGGFFLLPDGSSHLLLPVQAGDASSFYDFLDIEIKDPLGGYNPTGLVLRSTEPVIECGPGVYRVKRPETTAEVGVQYDAAS